MRFRNNLLPESLVLGGTHALCVGKNTKVENDIEIFVVSQEMMGNILWETYLTASDLYSSLSAACKQNVLE